jgi:lipid-A-disaccharide synthase
MYGAELIKALRRQCSNADSMGETPVAPQSISEGRMEFFGVGGEKMAAAGCDLLVDAKELSVVGITEILGHLPKIWGLFHKLIAEADKRKPDLAIVIDSPAFNWRVAREMKKCGVPVVYYVCPQFWAWRQGRVRYLRRYVDKALVIFPFEEKFYRDRGVDAEFVGHPLAELPRPTVSREQYATKHRLNPVKQWITLMPGSRRKEVRMNLPEILETAEILGSEYEFLLPVAPTLEHNFVQSLIDARVGAGARLSSSHPEGGERGSPAWTVASGPTQVHLVPEALPALAHSRVAIVASGTATVEAAMMETPFVMVYRVTPLSYLLGRWMVKVPHFAMVNLIAGEEVVPELIQQNFTAEKIVAELKRIIVDGVPRERMIEGLRKVKNLLRAGHTNGSAADRTSEVILQLLRTHTVNGSKAVEAVQ